MSNQLTHYQGLAFGELTPQDITVVRNTIAKDCNEEQFRLFMSIAKASGANPVINEIYPAVRSGQLTVQFGYDFYVRKAKESEGYLGYDVQLVHENDELKVTRKTDEQGRSYMVISDHNITFPRGKIIAAYAVAFREGVTPFTVFMEAEEVEHFRKSNIGMQKTMWTNYYGDMFKKHVLRRALKGQFGLEFDDQPVEGGSGIPEYEPQQTQPRKDITPQQDIIDAPPTTEEDPEIKKAKDEMKKKFKQLGISGKDAIDAYIKKHAPNIGANPTLAELKALLQIMDMDIELQIAETADGDALE